MDNKKGGGRITAIPGETRAAMKEMRESGKTIKEIADFFKVSQNTVLKYCGSLPDASGLPVQELNTDVQDLVLGNHAKRVLNQSKKIDADTVHAGEALREYFKTKGLDIDLRKIPADQLVKLVKSPIGDDMNVSLKNYFDEWLEQQLTGNKSVSASPDTNKLSFNDMKEILFMKFLMKAAGDDNNSGGSSQWQQLLQEMREENQKLRQEMREIMLEKRFQSLEDKQTDIVNNLSAQLEGLQNSIVDLKSIPNPTPEQKTALGELSAAASELNKVKASLIQLGLVQAAPGTVVTQSPDAYKNADGSTDYVRFVADKLESSVRAIAEISAKNKPDKMEVRETPAPEPRVISMDEAEHFYQQLLQKPSMTPVETDWLNRYLLVRAQYFPAAQPRETPAADDTVSSVVSDPVEVPVEAKVEESVEIEQKRESVLDRLREAENEEIRRAADLGSIGF